MIRMNIYVRMFVMNSSSEYILALKDKGQTSREVNVVIRIN